jgi:hypothetical protein
VSANVIVVGPRDKDIPKNVEVISTVSKSKSSFWRQLSPFLLGPCKLWGGHVSRNMENGWQYSKVYSEFEDGGLGHPTKRWLVWAKEGWDCQRAIRYPMGKGVSPEYSWWDGKSYDYVQARAKIYIPLYARAVAKTEAFSELRRMYKEHDEIWLWDFDGYDRRKFGMSLIDVLTCTNKKMGHAFVLAMMLKWGKNFWRR